jgi:hypothetical protein
MGVNIRAMPDDAVQSLPELLCDAGLSVVASGCTAPGTSGIRGTEIRCRRGKDEQVIRLYPHPRQTGELWVMIAVPWSLWPGASRRRQRLHWDVVEVIERQGGYVPFPPWSPPS